jgi:hypothetical protein
LLVKVRDQFLIRHRPHFLDGGHAIGMRHTYLLIKCTRTEHQGHAAERVMALAFESIRTAVPGETR